MYNFNQYDTSRLVDQEQFESLKSEVTIYKETVWIV